MKKLLLFYVLALLASCVQAQSDDKPANWQLIVSDDYPAEDVGVATYTVTTDFGADPTGAKDSQNAFQTALSKLGENRRGGTLFVPAGRYRISGKLFIPTGVTMRGEWKRPVKGKPVEGTILMVDMKGGSETESNAFITMEPSTALTHLNIWYPHQDPDKITPYPPTILYGRDGVWGNDYCNVRHVTLVNSYSGIVLSRKNGGGCPNIYDVYGTPLFRGIEIDNIADVGRFEWIHFSPDYWAGSGLEGAPGVGGAYADWIYRNGTGIVMRRNDWSYTCYVDIEGYNKGFRTGVSLAGDGAPNGHNYGFTLRNCKTGIYVDGTSSAGIMFTRVHIEDCERGVVVTSSSTGPVQLYGCEISASDEAVLMEEGVSAKLMMQQCTVNKGAVNSLGGDLMASDTDFNNDTPQIYIGSDARTILTGNRFAKTAEVKNQSLFECRIDHTPVETKPLPDFPEMKVPETKPDRLALYNVLDFGAEPFVVTFNANSSSSWLQIDISWGLQEGKDNTEAIQKAMDKAASEGGGIVYLPGGRYKVLGNLTVPTGVELRGASDFATVPKGHGSILEVYAGRGQEQGQPFLKLSAGSGLRGLTFDYPEQVTSSLPTVTKYPYCIQVTGKDAYIVNVGVRAAYNGVDLFTYKCDNHYVDYLAGHVFMNAIRIGGGSEGGRVCNMQFNSIVYACGSETKFGSWPNSLAADQNKAYKQNQNELRFITVGDCRNQILYNDFHYGGFEGIVFQADGGKAASGRSLGLGIDGSWNSVVYEALDPAGFDMINSQLVALEGDESVYSETRFLTTKADFSGEVTLFGADFWGSAKHGVVVENGKLNLNLANFSTSGQTSFMNLPKSTGTVALHNAVVNTRDDLIFASSGHEKQAAVTSTVTDVAAAVADKLGVWENNLPIAPVFTATDVLLSRTKWTITASTNNSNAPKAIDDDAATRWDTNAPQQSGQWVIVDMQSAHKLNRIILDTSKSPGDGPAGCEVYLNTGIDGAWKRVASGKNAGAVQIISFPAEEASKFRIVQTGSKGNYWSIHELYAACVDEIETGISPEVASPVGELYYYNQQLSWSGLDSNENTKIEIIDLSGRRVLLQQTNDNYLRLPSMQNGFYIVIATNGADVLRKKIFFKD